MNPNDRDYTTFYMTSCRNGIDIEISDHNKLVDILHTAFFMAITLLTTVIHCIKEIVL